MTTAEKRADELLYKLAGCVSPGVNGPVPTEEQALAIAINALNAAHAAGRREGIEECVKECERLRLIAKGLKDDPMATSVAVRAAEEREGAYDNCKMAIRALTAGKQGERG